MLRCRSTPTGENGVRFRNMTKDQVKSLVDTELDKEEAFDNWHGINRANLKDHLVDPYPVIAISTLEGDDPTEMWIVLLERKSEVDGYLIAYCPQQKEWCLVEKLPDGRYLCDTAGDESLAMALSNM